MKTPSTISALTLKAPRALLFRWVQAAIVAAGVIALSISPAGAQEPTPPAEPTPTLRPAGGIVMYEDDWSGGPSVLVYWDRSVAPGYAWVAYVNLTEWLNTATNQSDWANAIQWTESRPVGAPPGRCYFIWCRKDGQRAPGLTPGDTYIFTVVKSADGQSDYSWPDPVWQPFTLSDPEASPAPSAAPTPTPTPMPTPTPTPTGSVDYCDTPFAPLLPQCQ